MDETQRDYITFIRSHSSHVAELGLDPTQSGQNGFRVHAVNYCTKLITYVTSLWNELDLVGCKQKVI